MTRILTVCLTLVLLCYACSTQPALPQPTAITPSEPILFTSPGATATSTLTPAVPTATATRLVPTTSPPTATATPSFTPLPTLDPADWQNWPILPEIGRAPRTIYLRGQALGNNPRAFSKVGDCGSTPAWFLGDFDRGKRFYNLGDYQYLEAVIAEFAGSFARTSLAAKSGFNASSVFATLWADRKQCLPKETPLACEYRLQKPSFAFVMLGSNDIYHLDVFEAQMRRLIEFSIEQGVIPILSTKADNLEGTGEINATLARLALEYDLPLLNYWRAVQPLPGNGLQEDGVHLSWGPNKFNDPRAMQTAWTLRNLLSLQILDRVWRNVSDDSP